MSVAAKIHLSLCLAIVLLCNALPVFADDWTCSACGNAASNNFCNQCGAAKPIDEKWLCTNCGAECTGNFCSICGAAKEYVSGQTPSQDNSSNEEASDSFMTLSANRILMEGFSMYPTIHNGEELIFETFDDNAAIRRFDVIVCHFPNHGDDNFIKRVVGLPGDTISVEDGYLYVNGDRYEEDYLVKRPNYSISMYTVPEGTYYLLGDNRSNSNDSHLLGPFSRDLIVGRVIEVVVPTAGETCRPIPNGLEDTHPRILEPGL